MLPAGQEMTFRRLGFSTPTQCHKKTQRCSWLKWRESASSAASVHGIQSARTCPRVRHQQATRKTKCSPSCQSVMMRPSGEQAPDRHPSWALTRLFDVWHLTVSRACHNAHMFVCGHHSELGFPCSCCEGCLVKFA